MLSYTSKIKKGRVVLLLIWLLSNYTKEQNMYITERKFKVQLGIIENCENK